MLLAGLFYWTNQGDSMKPALCIGINDYPGTDADLSGCVNDAHDWASYLGGVGFNVTRLVNSTATKQAMATEMERLLQSLTPGDTGVITYSGHGTWLPDLDGDEPDRRDEALCPYDMTETNLLMDDEIRALFINRPKDTFVVFVTDSCHSGTVFRFAGPSNTKRTIRYMPPANFVKNPLTAQKIAELSFGRAQPKSDKPLPGVVHLSGCRDREYSYDAVFNQRPNGALTYAMMQILATGGAVTYGDLFKQISNFLPSWDYPQTPRLNADKAMKARPLFA